MMDTQSEFLNKILRCQLTAVNQQFIHVLALRDWGYAETAERIMAVDRVDFPNAMRIIDYLVQTRAPILLASDRPTPGTSHRDILVSEHALEQRLFATIEKAVCTDDRPRALVSAARAPREGYTAWLHLLKVRSLRQTRSGSQVAKWRLQTFPSPKPSRLCSPDCHARAGIGACIRALA